MPTRHGYGMWVLRSRSFRAHIHALPSKKPQVLTTITPHVNHPFRVGEVSSTELLGELITFMQLRVDIFDGERSVRLEHLCVFFVNRIEQLVQLTDVSALGPTEVPQGTAVALPNNLDSRFVVFKYTTFDSTA